MLNTPWIHPRDVDWTDSHNPLRLVAWHQTNNRYMNDTLNDPLWMALRNAKNLEARIIVTPVPINQTIAPLSTFDQTVSIDPVTWVYAVNAQGSERAGFYVQITDALTGSTVFSQLMHNVDLSTIYPAGVPLTLPGKLKSNPEIQAVEPGNDRGALIYLASPRLFTAPSYPIVRIVNLASVAQVCTVNMFCAVEIEQGRTTV